MRRNFGSQMACKMAYIHCMSLQSDGFPIGAVTFDLTDQKERFIVGVIHRFFGEHRRLYRVLAMRRVEVVADGKRRRLVLQAVREQAGTKRPKWQVLAWDIDGPGVRFYRRPTKAAMLTLFASFEATS
jgi:hypothetical protein